MTAGPAPQHEPQQEEVAERIAAAVTGVPGVAGLHGGAFGEVATYLPRRRVAGVRDLADRIEVHLTLDWEAPLRATADAVRDTVTALGLTGGRPVHIVVRDLVQAPVAVGDAVHDDAVGHNDAERHNRENT